MKCNKTDVERGLLIELLNEMAYAVNHTTSKSAWERIRKTIKEMGFSKEETELIINNVG